MHLPLSSISIPGILTEATRRGRVLICAALAMLVTLIYMALKIYDLTQFVEDELRPILSRADDMMRTAHSRTVFISDTAVKPVIGVMGYVSAVKSIIRSFNRSSR